MAFSIPTVAKAWRYPPSQPFSWNSYHSLELRNIPIPVPGKGEVLVKMHAAALNSRSPKGYTMGPDGGGLIPTSDGTGEIVAVGEGVAGWAIGDRVHSLVSESWVSGPLKREAASKLNSTCAGSGGVSVLGAQFAKAAGARVIATTSSQEKAQKYKDLGVDHVINYRETPNWVEEVKKVTDGQGVDQVLEIGGKGTLMGAIRSMNAGGVVHLIGSSQDDTPITGFFDLTVALMSSEIKLNGVAVGGKDVGQRLDSFLSQHNLNPFLDPKVFGWHDAKEAFAYLESGAHFGKVVVRID
ncbi:oxidoreductase [Rhizoctonia solani]|uniref:Oxidoreductase n=1 Tax=Rhizoctonia solani TaxID=456999 RepID=A0A8H7I197_9AGAM|nr:oxidoreductase [Rhizoctonia solani]